MAKLQSDLMGALLYNVFLDPWNFGCRGPLVIAFVPLSCHDGLASSVISTLPLNYKRVAFRRGKPLQCVGLGSGGAWPTFYSFFYILFGASYATVPCTVPFVHCASPQDCLHDGLSGRLLLHLIYSGDALN